MTPPSVSEKHPVKEELRIVSSDPWILITGCDALPTQTKVTVLKDIRVHPELAKHRSEPSSIRWICPDLLPFMLMEHGRYPIQRSTWNFKLFTFPGWRTNSSQSYICMNPSAVSTRLHESMRGATIKWRSSSKAVWGRKWSKAGDQARHRNISWHKPTLEQKIFYESNLIIAVDIRKVNDTLVTREILLLIEAIIPEPYHFRNAIPKLFKESPCRSFPP